jgi:hypothetical protein
MATDRPSPDDLPVDADELEQRQDLHGRLDELDGTDRRPAVPDGPVSPDVVEQHQRLDGSLEGAGTFGAPTTAARAPLDADVVEQQREDEHPEDDGPADEERRGS